MHFALKRGAAGAAIFVLFAVPALAPAQPVNDVLRNHPKVVQAIKPAIARPSQSAVRVRADGKDVALGAVVGADGWVLTKASEVQGKELIVRLRDGRELSATVVGVDEPYDLALLKVGADKLTPVEWRDSGPKDVGRWVVSVAPGDEPAAVGVISVAPRGLKAGDQPPKNLATNSGYLGVGLDEGEGGALVIAVEKGAPAAKAGIKLNDLVTHISGQKIVDAESMVNTIQRHRPGEEITIRLKRDGEELEVKATLAKRPAFLLLGDMQNRMGSSLSNRRGGFPSILQHDTVLRPSDCGGPLVDLDGKVVGINIARAGRTETYAVPSAAVRELLPELMSGRRAPMKDEKKE